MFDKFYLSFIVVWLATSILAFADDQTDDKEEKATKEKIATLIVQLGDSSFTKRVEAEKGLFGFGESALEQLSNAAKNTREFEIKFRASKLIEKIIVDFQQSRWLGIKFALLERGEFSMGSNE